MSGNKLRKVSVIFRLIQKIFTYIGLPSFRSIFLHQKSKFTIFFYNIYVAIIEIGIIFLDLRVLARPIFDHSLSMEAIIETVIGFSFVFQTSLRSFILYRKRGATFNYLAEINEIPYISFEKDQEKFLKMFKKNCKVASKLGKNIVIFLFIISVLTFIIGPFVLPSKKDLAPALYPLRNLHYSLTYAYHMSDFIGAAYALSRSTAMDLFCLTFVIFHITQQQYLKEELRKLLQEMKYGYESKKSQRDKLAKWYRLHQDSLSSLEHLKGFLEPLLLVTYVYGLISVVNVIFFTLAEGDMGAFQKTMGIVSISTSFAFVGWLCLLTDELNKVQEELLHQFDLDFVAQNLWLKNHYLIFAPLCYRKLKISALGLFKFSAKGFTEIMSTSFSMLATFWQIKKRQTR